MGIQIIRSDERYHAQNDWLSSRFSFSFAEYYDPQNQRFGALRVLNDDIIAPQTGFGMHPHADFEIMSYVIDGVLEHKDSMGNKIQIRAGEVQRMTAGKGVLHSEKNPSAENPVHLLQIWFYPNQRGLTPSYEQRAFEPEAQQGRLLPVVSGHGAAGALAIHQDVTVYLSRLAPGQSVTHTQMPGRRMHLFVIEGEVVLSSGERLQAGDAARITETQRLTIEAAADAHLMLMDLE